MKNSGVCLKNSNPYGNFFQRSHSNTSRSSVQFFKSQDPQRWPPVKTHRKVTGDPQFLGSHSSYSGKLFTINYKNKFLQSERDTSTFSQTSQLSQKRVHSGKFQEQFENFCPGVDKDIGNIDSIPAFEDSKTDIKLVENNVSQNLLAEPNNKGKINCHGVMQESCTASATTSTSAFLSNNIFTNFSNFIDDYNLPLGKGSQNSVLTHSTCASRRFNSNDNTIQSTVSQGGILKDTVCIDVGRKSLNNTNPVSEMDTSCLVSKKAMEEPLDSGRTEKTYFSNSAAKALPGAEEGRSSSNNEFETENFSSIFAKSLTSLYSSEPENPYDNEVSMKCDVPSVGVDSNSNSLVRGLVSKGDTKTLASDGISDHSFDSAFRHVDQQIGSSGNKIKLGRTVVNQESSDSGRSFGEGRFSDSTFNCGSESLRCYQYDPYDVTNSFYREGHAALPKNDSVLDRRPELCSGSNSDISNRECGSNPSALTQKDSRAKAFSRKARYDVPDSYSGKRIFRSMRLKGIDKFPPKRSTIPGFCAYGERNSDELTEKRMQKRISALSVYAKVQDDVIMSVICKRFKKRTKPMGIIDDEADNFNVSILSCASQDGLKITFNKSVVSKHQEDHSEVVSAVRATVNRILTTLSQRNNEEANATSVMEEMDSTELRELVFKLCLDYSLDRRDFEDIDLVTKVHVIEGEKQEETRKRGRKRQRIDLDKNNRTRSEASSAEATDHTPEVKNRTAIHRILRSLPSRQNLKQPRRNGTHCNFTRAISPPSFVEDSCTIPEADIHEDIDDQNIFNPLMDKKKCPRLSVEDTKDIDDRLSPEDTLRITKHIDHCDESDKRIVMEFSEDTNDTNDASQDKDNSTMLTCPSMNTSVKDLGIYKPPELVRMRDDSSYFDISKEYEESNHQSESDRFSPSYLTANGIRETSETPPSEQTIFQVQGDSLPTLDDDSEEEELVIDMSYNNNNDRQTDGDNFASGNIKTESSPIPQCASSSSEAFHHQTNQDDQMPQEKMLDVVGIDDDCIIIPSDDDETSENFQKSERIVKKEMFSDPSVEAESKVTLPKSDLLKDQQPSPSRLKLFTKEERDESILRNLLLDPSENIPSASLGNSEQDLSSSVPIITNVISLNGMKALCPSPNATDDEALCARSGLVENTSPCSESSGVFRTPDANHVPNHHRQDAAKFPQTLHAPSFGDAKCDLRSLMQKVDVTPPRSPLPGEAKDHSWTKDPDQLKDKIKKLKNEIVYLQMMAEQKEKEKTAIICFKKYKEEILRRICKAYAYTAQNQVRDIPHPEPRRSHESHFTYSTHSSTAQPQRSPYLPPRYNNLSKQVQPMGISDPNYGDISTESKSSLLPSPHAKYHPNTRTDGDIDIPTTKPSHISGEKLPAVEAMVAEASDNYGVDMRSVKKETSSQSRTESVNAILRKALSAKESSRALAAVEGRWPTENPQCHSKFQNTKSNPSPQARFLSDLDSLNTNSSRKGLSMCNSIPADLTVVHNQTGKPRFDAMVKDPQVNRNNGAVYNSWNNPMNRNQVDGQNSVRNHTPPSTTITTTTRSPGAVRLSQSFSSTRHDVPERTSSVHASSAPMKSVASQLAHHRGHPINRTESSLNDVLDRIYSRKTEERKNSEFPPMMSANGTMPYGGRLVRGETASCGVLTKTTPSNTRAPRPATCPPCMGCGISDAKFLCSGCRKHWYCSPQCQSLRWPEHSQMCAGRIYAQAPGHFS